tara:strand:+ start:1251 stop:2912 length:1662 start_codon:yes stop_codon:yes gene_type:complete
MAIQRIERYGKFRPSPIDESRVRRMEQLAGIAGGIAQTARAFGEARAAEEAPEKAQAAVEEAIQTDPETGEVTFGKLPEAKGYGASATNKLALSIYDSSKSIYLDEKLDEYEQLHPNDLQQFTEKSQALLQEITANSSLETRTKLLKEYSAKFKTSSKNIQKTIDDEVKQAGKASYVRIKDQFTKELNKAYQDDDAELQQILKENFALTMKPFIENDIITEDKVIQDTLDLENKKNITTFKAKINNIVDNEELDIDQRAKEFDKVEDQLTDLIKDFSPEDQQAARNYVKTSRTNAFSRDKRRLQNAQVATFKEQIDNFNNLRDQLVSEDNLGNFAQKENNVRFARLTNQINDAQESALINYINSDKALNAINDDGLIDRTIVQVYDVLEIPEDEIYLKGIQNIQNDLLLMRASGKILPEEYEKVTNQIQNLTNKRNAQAGSDLSLGYELASNAVKIALPNRPELAGTLMRGLFLEAEPEVERLRLKKIDEQNKDRKERGLPPLSEREQNRVNLTEEEKTNIYNQYIAQAITSINNDRRQKLLEIITVKSEQNQ